GSSGMSQNISSSSSQCGVLVNFSSTYAANKLICITDSKGRVIAAFKPSKKFQSIVISTSKLHLFRTYNIYVGGTITGDENCGYYTNAEYDGDGKLYTTYKQSSRAVTNGTSSGMGGMMK
ncbi:MAG: dockerin type 1, partial [Bacilli bacterium]|nr:dockerin type 1 [Bacilli bacterium]